MRIIISIVFLAAVFFPWNTSIGNSISSGSCAELECRDIVVNLAVSYGVDYYSLQDTIRCESGFKHDGVYGDGGLAYGISQYHRGTFESFKKSAIKQGYPFEDFRYEEKNDQLELMAWAFAQEKSLKEHWTCFSKRAVGAAGR